MPKGPTAATAEVVAASRAKSRREGPVMSRAYPEPGLSAVA